MDVLVIGDEVSCTLKKSNFYNNFVFAFYHVGWESTFLCVWSVSCSFHMHRSRLRSVGMIEIAYDGDVVF